MARPLKNLSELVLLKRGVSLAGFPTRIDSLTEVQHFQGLLGGGVFCDELRVYTHASALDWMREIHSFVDLRHMENTSPVRDETLSKLWPVCSSGDGDTVYFYEPKHVFVSHCPDLDTLETAGDDLVAALNRALDFNPDSIPEDYWPVYWKPNHSVCCTFSTYGDSTPTAQQFLAAVSFVHKPSFSYVGNQRADLIWTDLPAHLGIINQDGGDIGPLLSVRLQCDGGGREAVGIINALREAGRGFGLAEK
jgi:hypothetical protein